MDRDTLSKYRAEIIERFINVEWIINAIISQHYFKRMDKSFAFEVLYDEHFNFGLRRSILKKIIKNIDNQKVQDLNRLNTIRNYFAHCNQEIIEGPDKTQKGKILDPRNIEKEIDFESLYVDFMRIVGGVEKYLAKLFQNLGGVLVKDLPKT